ncbi:MAG: AIR synthase-related protein [SAR324 cluster bacterium]|nr:AIR synthase-related protein [SAR324 cluster bacterium]
MTESKIYEARGVSSSKSEIHDAISDLDQGLFPGAFCKVLPDHITGDSDYCTLLHADGAGTKSSLAYIYWKETGDINIFKGIAQDSLIMNVDDMACVGAVDNLLLSNTIGRNKFHIPGAVIKAVIDGYEEVIAALAIEGVNIKSCGGETADLGDLVRTMVVDSTMMVRMKREDIIDLNNVSPGDSIIAFASYGQARWETGYNSGIGSNGLTAARHDVFSKEYATKYPESYSPEVPEELVYSGKHKLDDPLEGTPLNWGQAVLSPTRTYAPLIKNIIEALGKEIHGMVHCSGGGQTKCQKFGVGVHYIKDDLLPIPPIFRGIQKDQNLTLRDMMPVFNMGHRLELFCNPKHADQILALAKDAQIEAKVIGRVEKSTTDKNQLTIKHDGETLTF